MSMRSLRASIPVFRPPGAPSGCRVPHLGAGGPSGSGHRVYVFAVGVGYHRLRSPTSNPPQGLGSHNPHPATFRLTIKAACPILPQLYRGRVGYHRLRSPMFNPPQGLGNHNPQPPLHSGTTAEANEKRATGPSAGGIKSKTHVQPQVQSSHRPLHPH
jgi:hypothetical protein